MMKYTTTFASTYLTLSDIRLTKTFLEFVMVTLTIPFGLYFAIHGSILVFTTDWGHIWATKARLDITSLLVITLGLLRKLTTFLVSTYRTLSDIRLTKTFLESVMVTLTILFGLYISIHGSIYHWFGSYLSNERKARHYKFIRHNIGAIIIIWRRLTPFLAITYLSG